MEHQRTGPRLRQAGLAAALALAFSLPAAAQTTPEQPGAQRPCQAQPAPQHEKSGKDSLTETLAPCGGVLQPPATGDEGLTEPAPDTGKTPIIKPGEVPPQAPKQD